MQGMMYIGRVFHNFKEFYNDINGATLTGAIDVIVVEQQDGSYSCSPFHVRFGKLGVLRSKEKLMGHRFSISHNPNSYLRTKCVKTSHEVEIVINGEPQEIYMKLGESGEAFFVETPNQETDDIPEHLATSPIPISQFEELYNDQTRRRNSVSIAEVETIKLIELDNQVNDYTKRRYTADTDTEKSRKLEFLERQIVLGNLEMTERSNEDISLSLQSAKVASEDISKDETIFQMDSLEIDSKSESGVKEEAIIQETVVKTASKASESTSNGSEVTKGGKKKKRKKSLMKKKNSQRKTATANELPAVDVADGNQENGGEVKGLESVTDRSSLDSNNSESDPKDTQKSDSISTCTNSGRKVPLDPEFHFFSDTELTTGQEDSRPNTPIHLESVQSDTEFEVKKAKEEGKDDQRQSWAWGELPVNLSPDPSSISNGSGQPTDKEQHNSMLSSMFSFMKQTKHRRRNSNSEGVYLTDLSSGSIDPTIAAQYFMGSHQKKNSDADMDCESGNGPSLTQSPNSAEGSKSIDSDFDDHKIMNSYFQDMALSLCGWTPEPTKETFEKHAVHFSDLCNNPSLLDSPKLVVRLRNKYYPWKVAAPLVISVVIYQRPLPQTTIDQLCNMHMPQQVVLEEKEKKTQETSYSWFGWRRQKTSSREATPILDNSQTDSKDATSTPAPIDEIASTKIDIEVSDNSPSSISDASKEPEDKPFLTPSSEKCRKTLRLTSEQIARLNLRDGMNEVEFSVTTAYQGTSRCKCHLYKWKWDDKLVISDIDGTITKSDVLGHILPIVGRDWAQSGVAQLFNKIKDNGYKLLYLSARAIGQARLTRDYLKSIKQGDMTMPDGPLLLNPTSLINAFHREVIERKPEQFKISCLSDIRALFPSDSNPFYAGYGNRINDVWAYRAVGIPIVRIFTINPKGELKHELTQTFQSSYFNMSYIVDQLFPPLLEDANDYSQFVYWREPVPILEDIKEIE